MMMMMIGASQVKSSEEMVHGGYQQQAGVGAGYQRPAATGFELGSPAKSHQTRNNVMQSTSRPDTGMQRSAAQRLWNNQPVGSNFCIILCI